MFKQSPTTRPDKLDNRVFNQNHLNPTVTAPSVLLSSELPHTTRLFVWPPVALDLQNRSFPIKTRVQLVCVSGNYTHWSRQ